MEKITTIDLDSNHMVDVKRCNSGLVYIMQNPDGSTVFDRAGNSCPDFEYNEADVLAKEKAAVSVI